jgi:hypothetical protein
MGGGGATVGMGGLGSVTVENKKPDSDESGSAAGIAAWAARALFQRFTIVAGPTRASVRVYPPS